MWESDRWIIHPWIYNNGGAHEGVAKKRNSVCRTTGEGFALGMPELGCYAGLPPLSARQRRPSQTPMSCSNYDGKCPFAKVQYLQPFTRMLQSGANVIEEATKRRPLRSKALRFSKGFPINEIPLSASPWSPQAACFFLTWTFFSCGLLVAYLYFTTLFNWRTLLLQKALTYLVW